MLQSCRSSLLARSDPQDALGLVNERYSGARVGEIAEQARDYSDLLFFISLLSRNCPTYLQSDVRPMVVVRWYDFHHPFALPQISQALGFGWRGTVGQERELHLPYYPGSLLRLRLFLIHPSGDCLRAGRGERLGGMI